MNTSTINTTYSDLVLMIGGQILILFMLVMLTVFGVDSITLPLSSGISRKTSSSSSSSSS